jgi:dynactin 1
MSQNEAELDRLSKNEQEQESILELATLDREMAEERAEQAEAEIETLRQRLEEKELELDILHSEAELLTDDMSDEAKHAAGYHRLQTENERLKEALVRLKEITEEQEDGLKQRVKELEDDLELLEEMKNKNNNLEAQVVEQEGAIELLRQQLDASNASEEIIEE